MEKASRELFECPVCFEIPQAKIFQCCNGHPICDHCSKGLLQCPQCREGFGKDNKTRCRVMEAFVAGMEIGCRYEEQGCKTRLSRKDLAAHLEKDCDFSPTRSIHLCKILGLANCNFVSRRGGQEDIHRHFVEEHGAKAMVARHHHADATFSSGAQEFARFVLGTSLGYMKNSKENRMTYHVRDLLIGNNARFKFLICLATNIERGNYSVLCLNLGDNSPKSGLFVEVCAPAKDVSWSWKGKPTNFLKAEEAVQYPPLQISIPHLLNVLGDEDENLTCKVSYF